MSIIENSKKKKHKKTTTKSTQQLTYFAVSVNRSIVAVARFGNLREYNCS